MDEIKRNMLHQLNDEGTLAEVKQKLKKKILDHLCMNETI